MPDRIKPNSHKNLLHLIWRIAQIAIEKEIYKENTTNTSISITCYGFNTLNVWERFITIVLMHVSFMRFTNLFAFGKLFRNSCMICSSDE